MVLGLLTLHALGLAAFTYTCFGGAVRGALAPHIWAGLIAVLLVVFAHTMSYFYLVAMTSMMKKALAEVPADAPGQALLARSRRLKASAMPWALGGMFAPMVAFILGGGAHTRAFPPLVHTGAGYLVFTFTAAAMLVVGIALLRQNRIVEAFQITARARKTGDA